MYTNIKWLCLISFLEFASFLFRVLIALLKFSTSVYTYCSPSPFPLYPLTRVMVISQPTPPNTVIMSLDLLLLTNFSLDNESHFHDSSLV